MHELSLCRSIGTIVRTYAEDRPVQVVHLKVGQLRQVVPDSLSYCWALVNDGTVCAGSLLDIDHVPAAILCQECGTTTVLEQMRMVCSGCAGTHVTVVAGEEFLVTSIELQGG